ncbi:F-box only protein 2-like [Denticeps clupeoides]|uniref:FBA domain-containing protein n=1 Tax=Denticeps clupeoides TaxID=299321 RepID=A0A8C4AFH9_9TELE|nr:F-box only protein 2-like [Denticeps clupeoides]XP_028855152.1 F-box only protein 2-like [Denticeps clupeoides]XP_028855153.1 F-box only protein 2-like [Denticeps clupeoides]
MARNLLRNPSGDEGLESWELTENGGREWCVEDMAPDSPLYGGDSPTSHYFATSFLLCLKKQVVDLVAEGFSPDQLDAQPAVTVEDWFSGRPDCGSVYQLNVYLLNENREMMDNFSQDGLLDPQSGDVSWKKVSHTFLGYGPGLRFVSFEHGGKDSQFWDGWYGVRVTRSSVTVEI